MEITYKDYVIRADAAGYTLHRPVPQKKDPTKTTRGEIGYYTSIPYMLEVMVRDMVERGKTDMTLQEYIRQLREITNELTQSLNETNG